LILPFFGNSQNITDENDRKQGHWVITNKSKGLPGYKNEQIIEEGDFENSKKTGVWTFYFNNRKIKHTLTYISNKPNGPATFYYKNGNLREKGIWKNNRWVGNYEMYYSNGNLKNEFMYNNQGVKNGPQKFYHKNGNLKVSGTWNNGDEGTDIHEYDTDGKANTKRYKAGPPIVNKIKKAPIKEKAIKKVTVVDTIVQKKIIVKKKVNKVKTPFDGNGYHKFKDREGRNIRVGEFKKGYLVNGKTFEYNKKGEITITNIIEKGKIVKIIDNSLVK
jgi:antitoxin component YwqK of YwqJK toxin-antitoxin module